MAIWLAAGVPVGVREVQRTRYFELPSRPRHSGSQPRVHRIAIVLSALSLARVFGRAAFCSGRSQSRRLLHSDIRSESRQTFSRLQTLARCAAWCCWPEVGRRDRLVDVADRCNRYNILQLRTDPAVCRLAVSPDTATAPWIFVVDFRTEPQP
jgi:hypothetical protein